MTGVGLENSHRCRTVQTDTLNFSEVNLLCDPGIFTDRKHFRNMNSVIFSFDNVREWMKKEGFQGFADVFFGKLMF